MIVVISHETIFFLAVCLGGGKVVLLIIICCYCAEYRVHGHLVFLKGRYTEKRNGPVASMMFHGI